jgi:hypothetical protein
MSKQTWNSSCSESQLNSETKGKDSVVRYGEIIVDKKG